MTSVAQASLTWKLRQRGTWLSVNAVFPPESASRVACTLLREFAGGEELKHSSESA